MDLPQDKVSPRVVSPEEWQRERIELLAEEKKLTQALDELNQKRRQLPAVKIEKEYTFEGPGGRVSLTELFEGRSQLIVYHFMFDADQPPPGKSGAPWEEGCPGCSHIADNFPHLAHLHARDTSLVMVSRAPLEKILPFKKRMGWGMPWYSSFGTDFNYDFHVTIDKERGSTEWNYQNVSKLRQEGQPPMTKGELPGLSVFLKKGSSILHTYSTYARGLDIFLNVHHLLDVTPFGRGEGWDGMPDLDGKGMDWLRHHDKYAAEKAKAPCCCS